MPYNWMNFQKSFFKKLHNGALSSLIVNDYGCDLCIVYFFCVDRKSDGRHHRKCLTWIRREQLFKKNNRCLKIQIQT